MGVIFPTQEALYCWQLRAMDVSSQAHLGAAVLSSQFRHFGGMYGGIAFAHSNAANSSIPPPHVVSQGRK